MILTLMLVILTATLVIVIIGFIMDRMAVTKLKSGMRTLNKRIKRLERGTTWTLDTSALEKRAIDELSKMDMEDVTYDAVDTEPQEENGNTLPDNTDGDI